MERWFQTLLVLAAVVLVSGCAETKSQGGIQGQGDIQGQAGIQGVSAQDPFYMIYGWHYEQDGPSDELLRDNAPSKE